MDESKVVSKGGFGSPTLGLTKAKDLLNLGSKRCWDSVFNTQSIRKKPLIKVLLFTMNLKAEYSSWNHKKYKPRFGKLKLGFELLMFCHV